MSVLLALPAMATGENVLDQQLSTDKRQERKTSVGKIPQAQKDYQQKRAAAKKKRDEMLKKRQQTINRADQAGPQ